MAEGIGDGPFSIAPWPSDRIKRIGDGVQGLGRQGIAPYASEPVSSVVAYGVSVDGAPLLVQMKARQDRNFYPTVAIGFLDGFGPPWNAPEAGQAVLRVRAPPPPCGRSTRP